MRRWTLALAVIAATANAAAADPQRAPTARAITPAPSSEVAPKACAQPACGDAPLKMRDDDDREITKPVDVKIPIGGIAIASMEGLWLRRGPTLRKKPIMVSPIVVGDALTLSLGGSF
ncbi:MAG TPA: hypothetical protein VL463_21760 [Kofleriaceae bacterium]|jgi:hypothetical protein|nr:hypothetical protein [Kofleriaceae bacterium]